VIVQGRVQGVFFRDSVRRLALEHGVAGWVRNNADESLEAVFEGPPAAIERLVTFCRSGPERAVVESVDVNEEPPRGERGFSLG
jgi:acylphosphatase